MINKIFVSIAALVYLSACSKKENITVVEYQVTAINSSKIEINYNNIASKKIMVIANGSWSINFTNPPKPFTAYVQAASTAPFSSVQTTCVVNILVNGSIVKTDTVTSNSMAIAEAEYIVK